MVGITHQMSDFLLVKEVDTLNNRIGIDISRQRFKKTNLNDLKEKLYEFAYVPEPGSEVVRPHQWKNSEV